MTEPFPALRELQVATAIPGLRLEPADRAGAAEILARSGWAWTIPLGLVAGGGALALRTRLRSDPERSPVLIVHGVEAVTLCSRAAHVVPMQMLALLAADPAEFPRLSAISLRDWDGLAGVHQAFGGSGALDEVRALIGDVSFRRALAQPSLRPLALADAQELLDDDPGTAGWARALAAAVTHERIPDLAHATDAWDAATAALAFVVARCHPTSSRARAEEVRAAWLMMRVPPGLDSARSSFPEEACHPGSRRSLALQLAAAQSLIRAYADLPDAWRADPWWSAIRALSDSGSSYDGTEHREVARALEADGALESAWTALAAACYWRHVSGAGQSDDVIADMHALRERHPAAMPALLPTVAPPAQVVVDIDGLFDLPNPGDDPANILDYPLLPAAPPIPSVAAPAPSSRTRRSKGAKAARSRSSPSARSPRRRRKR